MSSARQPGVGERVIEVRARSSRRCRALRVHLVADAGVDEHACAQPPATSSGRIASWMRLRSSGGARFSHSGSARRRTSRRRRGGRSRRDSVDQLEIAERATARRRDSATVGARLLQLDQHAVRRRRMDERDERAFGARPRLLVDQPDAARLQLRERRRDVVDAQRDVMQAGPALLEVLRDRRIRRRRLEQLERRLRRRGMKCARTRCDATSSRRLDLEPERVAIERQRRVEIADGDADVIEDGFHVRPSSCQRSRPTISSSRRVRIDLARGDPIERSRRTRPARSTLLLDVLQEAVRQQLAQAELVRARGGGSRCDAAGVRAERARSSATAPATPLPVVASVLTIGGRHSPVAERLQRQGSPRSTSTVRSAPSRSALLTTKMSAISMMPALSACTSSPVPGTSIDDRDVGGADDVDFVLADADGLDDDDVLAGGVEHERRVARSRAPGRRGGRASPCCG